MFMAQTLNSKVADRNTSSPKGRSGLNAADFGDFLKKAAQTQLCGYFRVCGVVWQVWTNSSDILKAAGETFDRIDTPLATPTFCLRFWMDSRTTVNPPWPKPYVRGLGHLVFAGFACGSSVLIDLAGRRLAGRFSESMARDQEYWKTVIFPILLSIVGGSSGVVEIHGACVSLRGHGLVLVGPSGSGKSTLSLALARMGFQFLSDDRTLCWLEDERVIARGTLALPKLRPDAGRWFEEVKEDQRNSNCELRFDPQKRLGILRARLCDPRMVIFLKRLRHSCFHLTRMTPKQASVRLEQDLMAESPEAVKKQRAILQSLAKLPRWHLQYGGPPTVVAHNLRVQFEKARHSRRGHAALSCGVRACGTVVQNRNRWRSHLGPDTRDTQVRSRRLDPLRRFLATPYSRSLPIMGRTVRLATNDKKILEHATELFVGYPGSATGTPEFLWRIVRQSRREGNSSWPKRFAFSIAGLRFAQFGHCNFVAVDLDAREAAGFLSNELVEDDVGLTSPILDSLFCMTVGSLRLVPLRANCVALGQRGLLVFGLPNSGKTTACYLARKLGLEFYADDGVFLESKGAELEAWGGFWPAAFRPEALEFLPELRSCTRPFFYQHFTFHHLNGHPFRSNQRYPVTPVGCVFLDRQTTDDPNLSPLIHNERRARLVDNVLFKDDDRFRAQQANVFNRLAKLPSYRLLYGSSPEVAALSMRRLLED